MGINFPNAPAVNDLYPVAPPVGVPQYQWDGTKWVAAQNSTGGAVAPINNPVFTGDPQAPTPALGDNDTSIPTTAFVNTLVGSLAGFIGGLTLSAPGGLTSFTVAAGSAVNSTNVDLMVLPAAITKNTAAWAVGTGNGALDTGAIAASTWYHVHLIKRPDTKVVDVLVSLSPTAPTLPANYTEFRRIGSMKTNSSSQWFSFSQFGSEFRWPSPGPDINDAGGLTTTPKAYTLASVPTGVRVIAKLRGVMYGGASNAGQAVFYSPDEGAQAWNSPAGNGTFVWFNVGSSSPLVYQYQQFDVRTNAAAQIMAVGTTAGGSNFQAVVYGWIDIRGGN